MFFKLTEVDIELIGIVGPEKAKKLSKFQNHNSNDSELRAAGLKTSLILAEEKNQKYERKCNELEEELKEVYKKLIKISDEKKNLKKKCNTLEQTLDKVKAQPMKKRRKKQWQNRKKNF